MKPRPGDRLFLTEDFRAFSQSLQANIGYYKKSGHDRFFPNPL
jgi:hypothetical protein